MNKKSDNWVIREEDRLGCDTLLDKHLVEITVKGCISVVNKINQEHCGWGVFMKDTQELKVDFRDNDEETT